MAFSRPMGMYFENACGGYARYACVRVKGIRITGIPFSADDIVLTMTLILSQDIRMQGVGLE